jgi:magnesium-transporting ATPase (P-type)
MTLARMFTKELLSIRNCVIYLLVLLYIIVYLLGRIGVLPAFTGNFSVPVALLLYGIISSFLIAAFSSKEKDIDSPETVKYRVIRNAATGELLLPLSEIAAGDSLILRKGDYIPISGDVVAGHAFVYENGKLSEKKSDTGRVRRIDCSVQAGSVIYAGSITLEVTKDGKMLTKRDIAKKRDKKSLKFADLTTISVIVTVLLAVAVVVIRFIIGQVAYLGTYEVLLDNLSLAFGIISISFPFCSSSEYLIRAFAKQKQISIKSPETVLDAGKITRIGVDAKLLYPSSDPVFNLVSADDSAANFYQNVTDANVLPEPIKGLLKRAVATFTDSKIGALYQNPSQIERMTTDGNILRNFVGLSDNETLETELISEIPFTPENGFSAVTIRTEGIFATRYFGKPETLTTINGAYAFAEAGREELSKDAREKILSAINLLSREGKRVKLVAVNHGRIRNGELPTEGWLILGYFVFPAVPTFAVKKAVNAAMDGGTQISLLPSSESSVYSDYLFNSLRLSPGNSTILIDSTDNKTASIALDIDSLIPSADVKIVPSIADNGIIKAGDMNILTKDISEAFTDATDIIYQCKKLSQVKRVLAILVMFLAIAMFVFYGVLLSPLPVAFGDTLIPALLGISLLWGLFETLILKTV